MFSNKQEMNWLEGTGNNAAGDSSWNQYKTGSAWTTAGGDYVTSNPAGVSTNMPAGYGWVDWDIKAIVKDAIANVGSIVNVLARFTNEANASQSSPYFYTREYATASLRPKLVITYTTPSGPANLKSYNTNLKANIKTINTNVIANIKSLNTNI